MIYIPVTQPPTTKKETKEIRKVPTLKHFMCVSYVVHVRGFVCVGREFTIVLWQWGATIFFLFSNQLPHSIGCLEKRINNSNLQHLLSSHSISLRS